MGYQSIETACPVQRPQTAITPKILNTALPKIVPIPRSLSVTKVPMMFAKNSGELVPANHISPMKSKEFANHEISL